MDQFVKFDGYKKGRLDDGHPAGPTHAKNQAHSFDQRKQAVHQRTASGPQDVHLSQFTDFQREVGKKLVAGMHAQRVEEFLHSSGRLLSERQYRTTASTTNSEPFNSLKAMIA